MNTYSYDRKTGTVTIQTGGSVIISIKSIYMCENKDPEVISHESGNPHRGSSLRELLEQDGTYEKVIASATARAKWENMIDRSDLTDEEKHLLRSPANASRLLKALEEFLRSEETPNADTISAIEEGRHGVGKISNSVKEFMDELNNDDEEAP